MTVSLVPLSAAAGFAGAAAGAVWAAPVAAGCAAGAAGLVSAGFGSAVGAATGLDGRQAASSVAAPPSEASARNRRRVRALARWPASPWLSVVRGPMEHP